MTRQPETIETWRKVWREGFAPGLATSGLESLAKALRGDDGRLLQGATSSPPPLQCVLDWPSEGACGVGWLRPDYEPMKTTVGEVEEYFARACYEADCRLGEPAACRHFLNWYDDTPRDEMRLLLLAEVNRELALRGCAPTEAVPAALAG